jgi:hypothetical protein
MTWKCRRLPDQVGQWLIIRDTDNKAKKPPTAFQQYSASIRRQAVEVVRKVGGQNQTAAQSGIASWTHARISAAWRTATDLVSHIGAFRASVILSRRLSLRPPHLASQSQEHVLTDAFRAAHLSVPIARPDPARSSHRPGLRSMTALTNCMCWILILLSVVLTPVE